MATDDKKWKFKSEDHIDLNEGKHSPETPKNRQGFRKIICPCKVNYTEKQCVHHERALTQRAEDVHDDQEDRE